MHRCVGVVPLLLIGLVAGCRDTTGPVELGLNRLKWEQKGLDTYAYDVARICDCPGSGQKVTVVVIQDVVTSASVAGTGVPLDKTGWLTIDGLFDLALSARNEEGGQVRLEFDEELGYPRLIVTSCRAIDCGYRLEITNVRGVISFGSSLPQG